MKNSASDYITLKEYILNGIIDINSLSEKELDALIEHETELVMQSREEADISFLDLCCGAMEKFSPACGISEEKCRELMDGAYSAYLQETIAKPRKKKTPFLRRFAAACAAVFAFCFISLSAAAIALGSYSEAWEYVAENVSSIIGMSGTKNVGSITVVKGGRTEKFKSVEDFLSEYGLDILAPSKLPEGVKTERILFKTHDDGNQSIIFDFNDPDYSFTVNSYKNDIGLWEEYTVYTAHGIDFYIVEPQEGIYQAIAEYADMQYCIVCGSYGELIFIISNLKG